MSEFDDIDDIMNDLMRIAGRLLEGAGGNAPSQPVLKQRQKEDLDEVIDGRDRLTYVLQAPERSEADFRVKVERDELGVSAPGIEISRRLPSPVDPKTAVTSYRNGVLSVSVKKA